ncbi:hypothetical protein AB0B45_30725 [Nonomuraea sp. NPDC049152]|uniref:hypothetical protein n=1 Tax=Nonomuraea sp. NPDC049152 TaxID=3154350 RepID=UPI0033F4B5DE
MRAKITVSLLAACALAGCGTATSSQPPKPKALTVADVSAPDPGGEVGSASSEFSSAADLAVWSKLSDTEGDQNRLAKLDVDATAKDALYLEPTTSTWFDGFRGPFVYQELAGDIVLHTRVKVEGRKSGPPRRKFSLGGAMLRVPQSNDRPNWLSVTTGTGDNAERVEMKETANGSSKPKEVPVTGRWMELILARTGTMVSALYKEEGGAWKVGQRWLRPDLPKVLEWGVTGYTDWDSYGALKKDAAKANAAKTIKGKPDLRLTVDYVRFLRPATPAGDLMKVPDAVLVKLLTPARA